ncbi:uncharacterized protein LOC110664327 [Hevea brasiliensis]|uniref:uncharacterized protein LOC110664327 n=1 Tax=Hevea brasiliensis TaxID=3981 RepID=UPI0025E89A30|nr:uncharacterized protein LOC110664327 [Hevea brasiliensis]
MPLLITKSKHGSTVLLEDQLRGLLKRYDANNDGKLSKAELKVAFKSLGSHFAGWRAMRAIHHADANGDGCISEDEMEELIKYAITYLTSSSISSSLIYPSSLASAWWIAHPALQPGIREPKLLNAAFSSSLLSLPSLLVSYLFRRPFNWSANRSTLAEELPLLAQQLHKFPKPNRNKMPFFINECKQASTVLLDDQLRGLLKRYDANNDGKLSKAELKVAFKSLGSHFAGWRAMRAIHHADANGDGCISEDEMEELIKYAIKLGFQMY